MAFTGVKYFHSELPGAPVLNGTPGSLIAVLDACLKDGWGLLTATSVTVTGGVATATFATGHAFEPHTVARVAGAGTAAINGDKRVSTTSANTISWPAVGVVDGPVSGTITVKLAPADWEKLSGTNSAAYRSGAADASKCWVRVADTGTRVARMRAYETMTDADTGVGPTPTETQLAGGIYVPKSDAATTAARKWIVAASDSGVVLLTGYYGSYPNDYCPTYFGDFPSLKAGDAYNCLIAGLDSDQSTSQYAGYNSLTIASGNVGVFAVRSYVQAGGSVACMLRKPGLVSSASGDVSNPPGPNPIDNSLEVIPTLIYEGTGANAPRRGLVPGIYGIPHALGGAYDSKQQIAAVVDLPGHVLIGVRYYSGSAANGCRYAVDITGPWV